MGWGITFRGKPAALAELAEIEMAREIRIGR